jgi:hypothetical protein
MAAVAARDLNDNLWPSAWQATSSQSMIAERAASKAAPTGAG